MVEKLRSRMMGFVPSDFRSVYPVLRTLHETCAVADRFCEWGSGVGVVVGLAGMIGYDAYGIEIRPELVEESRQLLDEFDLSVEILEGSFIPEEYAEKQGFTDGEAVTVLSGAGARDEVDVDIDDFDVIFAFPWPGEEDLYFDLFGRYGATGAHLVTYHGPVEGVRVQRKE